MHCFFIEKTGKWRNETFFFLYLDYISDFFCLISVWLSGKQGRLKKKTKNKHFCLLWMIFVWFFPFWLGFVCLRGKQRWKKRKLLLLLLLVWNPKVVDFVPMIPQNTKLHLKFIQSKDWKLFFFFGWYLCVSPPFRLSFVCLPGKQRWKKKRKLLLLLLVWNSKVMHFVPVIQSKD